MTEREENFKHNIESNYLRLCEIIDIETVRTTISNSSVKKYCEENNISLDDIDIRSLFEIFGLRGGINLLLLNDYIEAVKIIAPNYGLNLYDFNTCDPKKELPFFSFGDENPKQLFKNSNQNRDPSTASTDDYQMLAQPRGYCLLINNSYTIGSFKEMHRFRKIFFQFHFEVIMKTNLTSQQIIDLLSDVSITRELEDQDAFVLMIITHGNGRGEIYGFDGQPIPIQSLISLFDNNRCKGLEEKPKMFFFNCCRKGGDLVSNSLSEEPMDYAITNMLPKIHDKGVDKKRLFSDITICYSTIEGSKVDIDWNYGTKYGESLANAFIEKGWNQDLAHILRKAQRFNHQQMFEIKHFGDRKAIYFNPHLPNPTD